jgi:hypothetical protein
MNLTLKVKPKKKRSSTYLLTYLGLLIYLHIFLAWVIYLLRSTYLKNNFKIIHKIVAFGKKLEIIKIIAL